MPQKPDLGPLPGPSRRQRDLDAPVVITRDDHWQPVPGKPGHFVNQKGERRYDPFVDPDWRGKVLGAPGW